MTEIFIYDALKNKWDRKFTINKSPLPISPFTQSMKKMKIFAKFWQNILTHVVNISLKIWKFEGESPQNIEFDQQKHYSFSLWAEFRISTSVRQSSDVRKRWRFSSWSLQRWCCECSHISVLGQWQLVTPGPRCHQLTHHPAYTFCCKSPATRQEGHIYFDVVRRRIYFAIHVFFHFPVLLMPYCSEHLIQNSVWTILSQGSVFLDNLYLQIFKSYKLCKNANFRSVMARKYERNFCMANIMLHKKLCKKRNLSTYCLPVCLLANINIVLETPFFPFYHVSQPHNS